VPLKKTIRKRSRHAVTRNPDQTRRRILEAALKEFSERGFAGARVDAIARSAKINKRMLYHYFGDKDGLFCAVLHHKTKERIQSVAAKTSESEPHSILVAWFNQNCKDTDWVRLLAWESLQAAKDRLFNETERKRQAKNAVDLIRRRQKAGQLRADVPPEFLQLAKMSLAFAPFALPQGARLLTGRSPHDPKFQREYARFLETIAAGFRP
jgi:TetR/AcrR family transcriptional regulator